MSDLSVRSVNQIAAVDSMPPALRACVHEYGHAIVLACQRAGVHRPELIHELVREIWAGARQPQQRTASGASKVLRQLDWLLLQAGAEVTACRLTRFLANHNFIIVPVAPTRAMIDASLKEVSGFNERMTKSEKHRRRLLAAGLAAKNQWLGELMHEGLAHEH